MIYAAIPALSICLLYNMNYTAVFYSYSLEQLLESKQS